MLKMKHQELPISKPAIRWKEAEEISPWQTPSMCIVWTTATSVIQK